MEAGCNIKWSWHKLLMMLRVIFPKLNIVNAGFASPFFSDSNFNSEKEKFSLILEMFCFG